MATGVVLRGFDDFEGETLAVFLAGLDCGDFPVLNGIITVPFGSDADGFLTDHYLTQVSALGRDWGLNSVLIDGNYSVPCVAGYRYTSRGQLLRPVASADTGSTPGPGFGKYKRNHQVAVQLTATAGIKLGATFDRLHAANFASPGGTAYSPTELFTGIYVDAIEDDNSYDAQLCWEVDGPYSAMVNAIGGFIETEDK